MSNPNSHIAVSAAQNGSLTEDQIQKLLDLKDPDVDFQLARNGAVNKTQLNELVNRATDANFKYNRE